MLSAHVYLSEDSQVCWKKTHTLSRIGHYNQCNDSKAVLNHDPKNSSGSPRIRDAS